MKRFFLFTTVFLLIFFSWPVLKEKASDLPIPQPLLEWDEKAGKWFDNLRYKDGLEELYSALSDFIIHLEQWMDGKTDEDGTSGGGSTKEKEKELSQPEQHIFSVYNIELGDTKREAEKQLGTPKRVSANEYHAKWYTYHNNYKHFVSVIYNENNQVAGLFTNQDLISSTLGIRYGTPKETVEKQLGTPLEKILKGNVYYQIDSGGEYDLYLIDGSYVTIFYDKLKNNTVDAILIIDKDLEKQKESYYGEPDKKLASGFEYQLFDLTNAARVQHGLKPVKWDEKARETARKHSKDMADNHFFGHTNLKGQTPFDRMKVDNLDFTLAGENLAYGQINSIYAHEGLMNSKGHRENILHPGYEYLGVGVAFNDQAQPFFTETFYSK